MARAAAAAAAAAEEPPSVGQPTPEVAHARTLTPTKKREGPSLIRRLHPVSPNTPQGNHSAMQKVLAELDASKSSGAAGYTQQPNKHQALAELHAAYATSSPPESPRRQASVEVELDDAAEARPAPAEKLPPTEPRVTRGTAPSSSKTTAPQVRARLSARTRPGTSFLRLGNMRLLGCMRGVRAAGA